MTTSQTYGLKAPQIEYPTDGSVVPVNRFVWYPVEIGLPQAQPEKLAHKKIAIMGGQEQVALRLAATLHDQGAEIFLFRPENEDPEMAVTAFRDLVGPVDGVIDLNLDEDFSLIGRDSWERPLGQTVAMLKACYDDWMDESDTNRIFYLVVTHLGGKMGYDRQEIVQPLGGIWAGLAKSVPRELPNCNVKIVDFGRADFGRLDQLLAAELYDWGVFEVGYQNGRRYTLAARRETPGPASLSITPDDTILISGGARGIGFAMARGLAENFGCRVIITGRNPLPTELKAWMSMDDDTFNKYLKSQFKAVSSGKPVSMIKRETEHLKTLRELYLHMREVDIEGLKIEYRVCDFNSAEQVNSLLQWIGLGLSGIIHNAGIDTPVRMRAKAVDDFVRTVRIKVRGFVNIYQAVQDRPLKFFCNVGSLAGRMGGMIGQIDYAAGNEVIARLGFWAAGQNNFPVKTICWPTWEKLGVIANFEAALKYTSAINVEEGVYRWQRELITADHNEVMYLGSVGKALSPVQLGGFLKISEISNIDRLYTQFHYLGQVTNFQIFHSIRSHNQIDLKVAPCFYDFAVEGSPAMPVSLLLEYALSVGGWVVPEGWQEENLLEIHDLWINLKELKAGPAAFCFEKEGTGSRQNGKWVVEVRLTRIANTGESGQPTSQPLATMKLVHGLHLAQDEIGLPTNNAGQKVFTTQQGSKSAFAWAGYIFKPAKWSKGLDESYWGQTQPCRPSDLWTTPYFPASVLPSSHLENILKASLYLQTPPSSNWLGVERITFFGAQQEPLMIKGNLSGNSWSVLDAQGKVCLKLDGIRYRAEPQ